MENKTAVEWLIERITLLEKTIPKNCDWNLAVKETYLSCLQLLNQAIELEKQQIIDAYQWGRTDQNSKEKKWYNRNAHIYYSETYKPTL